MSDNIKKGVVAVPASSNSSISFTADGTNAGGRSITTLY